MKNLWQANWPQTEKTAGSKLTVKFINFLNL
jgi:hypothetical protein